MSITPENREQKRAEILRKLSLTLDAHCQLVWTGAKGTPELRTLEPKTENLRLLYKFHHWICVLTLDGTRLSYPAVYQLMQYYFNGRYKRWTIRELAKTYYVLRRF